MLSEALRKNTSIQNLYLDNCNLNGISLSAIFKAVLNNWYNIIPKIKKKKISNNKFL